MRVVLGRVVTVQPVTRALIKCPQCVRLLHLSAPERTDDDGTTYVDSEPIYRALGFHLSYGCGRRR